MEYHYQSIKHWHESERPREKLMKHGASQLHSAELIALIIRSGTGKRSAVDLAKNILSSVDGDLKKLHTQNYNELSAHKGIGEAKALGILAALELGKRVHHHTQDKKEKIISSSSAYKLFAKNISFLNHEEFWILCLDRANQVIKNVQISKGGMHGTVVDPKLIFKHAIDLRACGLILGHNHPSGHTKPSQQDIEITEKIKKASKLFDITVFDHIIVGDQSYFSFADNNLL